MLTFEYKKLIYFFCILFRSSISTIQIDIDDLTIDQIRKINYLEKKGLKNYILKNINKILGLGLGFLAYWKKDSFENKPLYLLGLLISIAATNKILDSIDEYKLIGINKKNIEDLIEKYNQNLINKTEPEKKLKKLINNNDWTNDTTFYLFFSISFLYLFQECFGKNLLYIKQNDIKNFNLEKISDDFVQGIKNMFNIKIKDNNINVKIPGIAVNVDDNKVKVNLFGSNISVNIK